MGISFKKAARLQGCMQLLANAILKTLQPAHQVARKVAWKLSAGGQPAPKPMQVLSL
jgi:hypothetical protein